MLIVYWSEPGDELMPLFEAPTIAAGFPARPGPGALREGSGRDLSAIDFYVALAWWKLAIILQGVYARFSAGQYGEAEEGIDEFARIVDRIAEAADEAERRLG